MPRQFVDRGLPLEGIQTAVRDSRVPYVFPRALQNVSLRDKRIRRRGGMQQYSKNRVLGQQLVKHTANSLHTIQDSPGRQHHYNFFRCPLSYGLLRWHEDFQPRTTKGLYIEFILTLGELEELVASPFVRTSKSTYGAGKINIRSPSGVYVYDQTVLANVFKLRHSGVTYDVNHTNVTSYNDVFPLTALAVAYNRTHITVEFGLWNDTGKHYTIDRTLQFALPSYTPGAAYHIGIRAGLGDISLVVDGEIVDSYTLAADEYFVGEYDEINGLTGALKRDIVLLNESTARAGYQSTCYPIRDVVSTAIDHGYQTFSSDPTTSDERREPWACSPPAGTGLNELRFWSFDAEDELAELLANSLHQRLNLNNLPDNLLSYFTLDSGTGYIRDQVVEHRQVTVHHTGPSLIDDKDMVFGKGLHFADNQYLIQQFGPTDGDNYISPAHAVLKKMFRDSDYGITTGLLASGEFTVELQIRTPYVFGQALDEHAGASSQTGVKSDTRHGFQYAKNYGLVTGQPVPAFIRDENGTAVTTTQMRWSRSFDATLWSVEGAVNADNTAMNNWNQLARIPYARAFLTPAGKVAFEFFAYVDDGVNDHTREFRVVSNTVLEPSTVYALTFRRRMLYTFDSIAANAKRVYGYALEIFINGVLDRSLTISDGTFAAPSADISVAGLTDAVTSGAGLADVIIGSAFVNHAFDISNTLPTTDSASYIPQPISQSFMSPRQDLPGFFTLGYFRMWHRSLSTYDISSFSNKSAPSDADGLLYQLEIANASGDEFFDQGPYSTYWTAGYKGWGYPQVDTAIVSGGVNITGIQVGWFMEDCLGYGPPGTPTYDATFKNTGRTLECSGMAFYSPTLSSTFGLLATFRGFAQFDRLATGLFESLRSPGYGLLSNYSTTGRWQGINIGDRTVLTSPSGYPKVFNGKHILPLGFRNYNGGHLHISVSSSGGSLASGHYGIRLFYFAERSNIYHISPQYEVFVPGAGTSNKLVLSNIPQHPDPRVTSIVVAMTVKQASQSLAKSAPTYATSGGYLPNKMVERYEITAENPSFILPTGYTKPPQGTTAASYNARLFIAGDPNIPDAIYYSDPGNPEAFDTLTNRLVLEEGSGDRIVALKALFGSLYAFKANSIWRIDEVAIGEFQLTRIAAIGPASEYAIEVITIPDTGRTAVIFWSGHGPYLFDEVNLQYLGFSAEHETSGFAAIRHDTVFTVHDVANRQVLFYYQDVSKSQRYVGALVYNYRHNLWTSDTGRPGYVGLSVDLTKRAFGSTADANIYTLDYLGLVGGDNGVIYKLTNDTELDGYDYNEQYSFDILDYNDGVLLLDWGILDSPPEDYLNGLWLTILTRSTKQLVQVPIIRNYDRSVELDLTDVVLPFTPQAGDSVSIGMSPVYVEFPWDVLDLPYFDKQLQRISFWATAPFDYAIQHSWRITDSPLWLDVNASIGKRTHVDPRAPTSECYKLYIQSMSEGFRLDGYGFEIEATREAHFRQ